MRAFIGIAIVGAFLFFIFSGSDDKAQLELSEGDLKVTKLNLERVLDLTVPVIVDNAKKSQQMNANTEEEKDKLFGMLFFKTAFDLTKAYNSAIPKIYEDNVGVYPAKSGSLVAYEDLNKNSKKDDTEQNIFFIGLLIS